MTDLNLSPDPNNAQASFKVVECIDVHFYIPPLFINGERVKFSSADIQGSVQPMRFLITKPDQTQIKAYFHPLDMRWELVDG